MDNWLANIVGDVDSLHVGIDNLNDPLVGFFFISIDLHFCVKLLAIKFEHGSFQPLPSLHMVLTNIKYLGMGLPVI
jgi:hypothetical protein